MNDRVDVGKFATAGMVSRNVVTHGGFAMIYCIYMFVVWIYLNTYLPYCT